MNAVLRRAYEAQGSDGHRGDRTEARGWRALVYVDGGVRVRTRRGREVTASLDAYDIQGQYARYSFSLEVRRVSIEATNKELIRRFYEEVWNRGNTDVALEVFA